MRTGTEWNRWNSRAPSGSAAAAGDLLHSTKEQKRPVQIGASLSKSISKVQRRYFPVLSIASFLDFPTGILCELVEMTASKGASSLLAFVPKALRPQSGDISGGVLWGATALTGAIFLVQPFDWIKEQLNPPKEEEKK